MRQFAWLLVSLVIPVTPCTAQEARFELGQRLRAFELAWDAGKIDNAVRERTVAPLNKVMGLFFGFQFGEAGRVLDQARHLISSADPPAPEIQWVESLYVNPECRLADADKSELAVTIKPFYKVEGELPKQVKVRLRVGDQKPTTFAIESVPQVVKVDWKNIPGPKSADLLLVAEWLIGDKQIATRSLMVSRIENLTKRLNTLETACQELAKQSTIEQKTAQSRHALLKQLGENQIRETNFPAARLLEEAEAALLAAKQKQVYFDHRRAGNFWLTLPVDSGAAIRIFVPEKLAADQRVPVVVALHGAGGSENLFFEGYGDGITQKQCKDRGWVMVATNAGPLGFGSAPPVPAILEALAQRYPLDLKRVYLVGHSMGAGHAMALGCATPERYRGIAALGGSGAVRNAEKIVKVPFFVGCGTKDFALRGATNLSNTLKKANVDTVEFKTYENIEHIVIVREAIPDVFAFFDKQK